MDDVINKKLLSREHSEKALRFLIKRRLLFVQSITRTLNTGKNVKMSMSTRKNFFINIIQETESGFPVLIEDVRYDVFSLQKFATTYVS